MAYAYPYAMPTEWMLYPKDGKENQDLPDPWDPWYDCCFKMVVRAESEDEAREVAQNHARNETTVSPVHHSVPERILDRDVWTDPSLTECIPISEYQPDRKGGYSPDDRMLIQDIHHA